MSRRTPLVALALPLALAGLSLASSARADVFDGEGWIFGAERTMGFGYEYAKTVRQDTKTDTETMAKVSRSGFALLGRKGWSPYSAPRFAVDYRLPSMPELTLGGAIVFDYGSHSSEVQTTTPKSTSTTITDDGNSHLFLFSPRAGWVLPLNDRVTFWPRAGFSIFNYGVTNADGTESDTVSGFGLDLEPTLVIGLTEHVGLHVGGALDLPVTGSHTEKSEQNGVKVTVEEDRTHLNMALNLGLSAWL